MVKIATLKRPDATLSYLDAAGARRALVLVHGAGVDSSMYAPQVAGLSELGHRVIAVDLRGHGASTVADGVRITASALLDDLVALLEHLRLDAPILVGHSLGGNLAQALVRRHPQLVGGLVAIDCTWNTGPLTALDRLGLRLAAPSLAAIPARRLPGLMASASAVTPEAVAALEAAFARMPKARFLDVWRATASLVEPDPGYRTPVPLTLVRGERDRTGNIAKAMPAWAAAEGVTEHVIPGAGHVPTLDAPDAVTVILAEAAR
ncbi:alpha/beta hydrolase [Protaetiibacter sp. SSC-01]|uniref:alpha/beta fold hydrolase n=1 Tax=Protaetiibacter sp. SSC-01 TaxID=2759943 RepID=UPI001656E052|nr:alpha/beta hydrolase [Protaetiibacter sp. SSC-01]QNO36707.1 alpha/beta hydrolase [Protaetiibacter sp. SSC-01]